MKRRTRPITISAHPATAAGSGPTSRIRVAWMHKGRQSWRVEFEEGREFAAALAVLDYADGGGEFPIDYFEATMLAAQILDTSESKFRSMSEHIATALGNDPVRERQAA